MRVLDRNVSPYLALLIVAVVGGGAAHALLRAISVTETFLLP